MRKFAHSLIILAWLIYISSMFLPVYGHEGDDWNGILTTLFSILSIKDIPSNFAFLFRQDSRNLSCTLLLIGIYGICNVIFIVSPCCLKSQAKFVMRVYKGFLIGASTIASTSLLWDLRPANVNVSTYQMGIGTRIWPLSFLILLLGTYQLERDKLKKNELIDDEIENNR